MLVEQIPYTPNMALVESKVGTYEIYVLINPETDEIFYVGQTCNGLDTRLSAHISEKSNTRKTEYIYQMAQRGFSPEIKSIETINTKCAADIYYVNHREKYWILHYKDLCVRILNVRGIDGDGSDYMYVSYKRSLQHKNGDIKHYYCGSTKDGQFVYDSDKLNSDGFSIGTYSRISVKSVDTYSWNRKLDPCYNDLDPFYYDIENWWDEFIVNMRWKDRVYGNEYDPMYD